MGKIVTNKFPLNKLIKELTLMIEKNPGGDKGIPFFTKELAKILKSYFQNKHSLISSIVDPPDYEFDGEFVGQFLLNVHNYNLWQYQTNNKIDSWIFICNVNNSGGSTTTNYFDLVFTASEDISQYDIVTQNGYIADSTSTDQENIIAGMSLYDVASGDKGIVRVYGEISDSSWSWDITKPIWINGTSISQLPPDFVNDDTQKWIKIIAKVYEPTRICIVDGGIVEVNR